MRVSRLFGVLFLVVGSLVASAVPALAQPPTNDLVGDATVVATFPFSEVVDTTEATTDDVDAALNANCGAPATDASVWYTLSVAERSGVEVQVFESDYSAGVIVATGSPDNLELLTCGPEAIIFIAEAGEPYWILAFDDQLDGTGVGGQLVINIDAFPVPPPPELAVTVDPVGSFDPRTGGATVSGTFTCTGSADFIDLFGEMRQRAGRLIVTGFFSLFSGGENGPGALTCDGETHPWSADVTSDNGLFKGGKADVAVSVFACNPFECGEQFIEQQVRLSGRR